MKYFGFPFFFHDKAVFVVLFMCISASDTAFALQGNNASPETRDASVIELEQEAARVMTALLLGDQATAAEHIDALRSKNFAVVSARRAYLEVLERYMFFANDPTLLTEVERVNDAALADGDGLAALRAEVLLSGHWIYKEQLRSALPYLETIERLTTELDLTAVPTRLRGRTVLSLGILAWSRGDVARFESQAIRAARIFSNLDQPEAFALHAEALNLAGFAANLLGRRDLAAERFARAIELLHGTAPSFWPVEHTVRYNLVRTLEQQGAVSRAEGALREAWERCEQAGQPTCALSRLHSLAGRIAKVRGNTLASYRHYLDALDALTDEERHDLRYQVLFELGRRAGELGRDLDAARWYGAAAEALPASLRETQPYIYYFYQLQNMERLLRADKMLEAEALLARFPELSALPEAVRPGFAATAAEVSLDLDRIEDARRILDSWDRMKPDDFTPTPIQSINIARASARLESASGHEDRAIGIFEAAVREFSGHYETETTELIALELELADMLLRDGHAMRVLDLVSSIDRRLRLMRRTQLTVNTSTDRVPYSRQLETILGKIWLEALSEAADQINLSDAVDAIQRRFSSDPTESLLSAVGASNDPAARDALTFFELARHEYVQLLDTLSERAGSTDIGPVQRRLAESEAMLRSASARLSETVPAVEAFRQDRYTKLEEIRAALDENEAFIQATSTQISTHVIVVTRDDIAWRRVEMDRVEMCQRVAHLRLAIDPGSEFECDVPVLHDGGGFPIEEAYALYESLFAEVEAILNNKTRWIFAVEGPLASYPMAALVTEPHSTSELRDVDWLIRTRSLALVPDATSFVALRSRNQPPDLGAGFIGVGDPCVVEDGFCIDQPSSLIGLRRTDVAALRDLPRLPGAVEELHVIERMVQGESLALTGAEARQDAIFEAPTESASVLVFATHGVGAGQFGAVEASLVMSSTANAPEEESLLSASEIAIELQSSADWIVLSACNSADGGVGSTDGLARAFFASGATRILATIAPVRDDVAARLSGPVIAAEDRQGAAERLQTAMIHLMSDESVIGSAHPAVWSPYVLIGDGR